METTLKNENSCDSEFAEHITQINSLYERVDVPKDGSCLFWSVALAYLTELEVDINSVESESNKDIKFKLACRKLFGKVNSLQERKISDLMDQFQNNQHPDCLYSSAFFQKCIYLFRVRVVAYMAEHANEFTEFIPGNFNDYLRLMQLPTQFGGQPEISAMMRLLNCNISVVDTERNSIASHCFDPNEAPLIFRARK